MTDINKLSLSDYGWEKGLANGSRVRGELYLDEDNRVVFKPSGVIIPPSTVGPEVKA